MWPTCSPRALSVCTHSLEPGLTCTLSSGDTRQCVGCGPFFTSATLPAHPDGPRHPRRAPRRQRVPLYSEFYVCPHHHIAGPAQLGLVALAPRSQRSLCKSQYRNHASCRLSNIMETESDWVSLFFDEEHIVQTFQLLLIRGNLTMGELHNLCVVAHESSLVLAFTSEGLTPFDSHREYIIPFANMSTCQLQYLLTASAVSLTKLTALAPKILQPNSLLRRRYCN